MTNKKKRAITSPSNIAFCVTKEERKTIEKAASADSGRPVGTWCRIQALAAAKSNKEDKP